METGIVEGSRVTYRCPRRNSWLDGRDGYARNIFDGPAGKVCTFYVPNRNGDPGYGWNVLVADCEPLVE